MTRTRVSEKSEKYRNWIVLNNTNREMWIATMHVKRWLELIDIEQLCQLSNFLLSLLSKIFTYKFENNSWTEIDIAICRLSRPRYSQLPVKTRFSFTWSCFAESCLTDMRAILLFLLEMMIWIQHSSCSYSTQISFCSGFHKVFQKFLLGEQLIANKRSTI